MNTGLEYSLALRMRSATRWVEGQQGLLSDDGDAAVDGFGRTMLVRTGALPSPYTGAEGVAGATIDQQPTGANVAGVAVLIKDLNGGKLTANTTYSARLGGFLTGKALYFVEAAASTSSYGSIANGIITGYSIDSNTVTIDGDDGTTYFFNHSGEWWGIQPRLACKFWRTGTTKKVGVNTYIGAQIIHTESRLIYSNAKIAGDYSILRGLIELFTEYNPAVFAYAIDPMKLAAHMTSSRITGPSPIVGPIFRAATYFQYGNPYGSLVSVTAGSWPVVGYDPITLVAYTPFWNGYKNSTALGAPLGTPLGG